MNHPQQPNQKILTHGATGFIVAGIPSVLAYLGPLHWTFELFTPFRFQYAMICLVYLLLCMLMRNYLAVACYGIVCGMNLQPIAPLLLPPKQHGEGADLIVAVHNVYIHNDHLQELVNLYDEISPDVLFVLEPSQALIDAIPADKPWARHRYLHMRGDPYSMAVFSKFAMQTETKTAYDYPYLVADVEHSVGPIRMVGVHAPLPWDQKQRNGYLLAATAEIATTTAAGLVLGDFNMTPYNAAFDSLLRDGQLTPARNGFGIHPTWPGSPVDFLQIPIDHILVNQSLEVISFTTGPLSGADHQPLIAKLKR